METEPKRRRRPPVSCILCRQRKIRCNRQLPCQNCIRSKNAECAYKDAPKGNQPRHPTVQSDQEQLTEIQNNLVFRQNDSIPLVTTRSTPTPHLDTESAFAGSIHFQTENLQTSNTPQAVTRRVSHKTRLFGQSHWINTVSLCRDMFDAVEPHMRDESSNFYQGLQRCKKLAKVIKQHRAPSWPCLPTSELPPKNISDQLVECYLQTIESIYRILHIPTFKNDYETLWSSPTATPDSSFLIQVKLVLAIGATTHDTTFSLKSQAIQWVYEGQTWLSAPEFKHHLGIPSIQSTCLLMFAREATGVGEDLIWASMGSLLRTAMYIGLHRDPSNLPATTSLLTKEIRRRLWNTILELSLHSSMISGGAPLIDLNTFDTNPPGNYDDEDLLTPEVSSPPKEDKFTQTTIPITLNKTFPQRLSIAKFLNDITSTLSSNTYPQTLLLDSDLKSSFKSLTQTLLTLNPSSYLTHSLTLLHTHYFLSLHTPFFSASLTEPQFTYSRKISVESSLRLWKTSSFSPLLSRQITNSSGFFRTAGIQAFIIIATEIMALVKEDTLFTERKDLFDVLEEAREWTWKCIEEGGETNIKGYLTVEMVCAQVKGVMNMNGKEEGDIKGGKDM
ncbi:Acetamidase regulatory protein [Podospora fimiseda]|uniref:Acetamidase regulatory protein n=1 Tax=Podospora fimiseda TaxID=252190 RepID=A0AAN7H5C6_9PEZI|nr:Acetamidase regulatory protein [Podospora fimiseda]